MTVLRRGPRHLEPTPRTGGPLRRVGAKGRNAGLLVHLAFLAGAAAPAAAQRPAELIGRVVDLSGAPVSAARIEAVEAGAYTLTDASGAYRVHSLSPGRYTIRVTRVGFAEGVLTLELESGRTTTLDVRLFPAALPVEGLSVVVDRDPSSGVRVTRAEIEHSGARSVGDLLAAVPGVVVRTTVPGGPQAVSIRGTAPNAVLVLVDGAVLNDPITGEADLSTVSVQAIESVTVLPGSRSAQYGPRAEGGVILIETRQPSSSRDVELSLGSLQSRSAAAAWGGRVPFDWSMGLSATSTGGAFDFRLPAEVGGGAGRRENADSRTFSGWLTGSGSLGGGTMQLRAYTADTDRGLPGKDYAPSLHARQTVRRTQASATWRRPFARGSALVSLDAAHEEARFLDPAPPSGLAYDDTAAVRSVGVRAEAEMERQLRYGGGIEVRHQRLETALLDPSHPAGRLDAAVFAHGGAGADVAGGLVTLALELRADRDPDDGGWALNRSVTLGTAFGAVHAYVANRSSFSPPTLGDQFFRDAVGVEPNPDLHAERIPSETEVGLRTQGELGSAHGSLDISLHSGDVRGMIVWSPDYRFIWSPRNVDVKRRGADLHAQVDGLDGRLRLGITGAYDRVTYDRAGPADTVQVLYRPRYTGAVTVGWRSGAWEGRAVALYTGKRYPVPAPVNALPAFWTDRTRLSRDWWVGTWTLRTSVLVDRLFDQKASLIFGFPDPGRVLRMDVSLRQTGHTPISTHRDPR